jgi:hypothetical protein
VCYERLLPNENGFFLGFVVLCIFKYSIKQPTKCTINLKILLFCRIYTAQHVSGTVVPIIRSPPPTAFAASGYRMMQRRLEGAPDDEHNSARNMLSSLYATKQ